MGLVVLEENVDAFHTVTLLDSLGCRALQRLAASLVRTEWSHGCTWRLLTARECPSTTLEPPATRVASEWRNVDNARPLIVDLDGTLVRTDTLHELIARAVKHPRVLVGAATALVRGGKAGMKKHLADKVPLATETLPLNGAVVRFVADEIATGRQVLLATGADSRIAHAAALRVDGLGVVGASDGSINLTSEAKATALVERFGVGGFDYVGNSTDDIAVWNKASQRYLATLRNRPRWSLKVADLQLISDEQRPAWRVWVKELRLYQSLKNLVLFLPALAAHDFSARTILLAAFGYMVFTFMASSVYLLNDLVDLDSDRVHQRKSGRPLAAGLILPLRALGASAVLAIVALVGATLMDPAFAVVLVGYAILTSAYSFWLKRVTLVDVALLAMLYMVRILAGAVITDTPLSFWFISVALFLFLSLALVKRYTELARQPADATAIPGRGYIPSDAAVILPLGVGAGVAVVLLMATYLQSDAVRLLYPSAVVLWLVIPVMFYWIGNFWIQAGRGGMHDDPILFALKDPRSLVAGLLMFMLFVVASTNVTDAAREALRWLGH